MPVQIQKLSSRKVRVSTPNGVKAKATTPEKAIRLRNLLNAVEHSDWRPSAKGMKGSKKQRAAKPNI